VRSSSLIWKSHGIYGIVMEIPSGSYCIWDMTGDGYGILLLMFGLGDFTYWILLDNLILENHSLVC
jgi:hypothetical protein